MIAEIDQFFNLSVQGMRDITGHLAKHDPLGADRERGTRADAADIHGEGCDLLAIVDLDQADIVADLAHRAVQLVVLADELRDEGGFGSARRVPAERPSAG